MYKVFRFLAVTALSLGLLGLLGAAGLVMWLEPQLPSTANLKDVQLQVPLRVYTRNGKLLAEFGEKRRTPVKLADVPKQMIHAFIAAEDERFYEHPGVDWQGLVRAAWYIVRTGQKGPGGSTITMQVARNFFLGRQKTYTRKLNEILLALKIERELTKNEILELYLNKIFLGQRAYGIGAAAQVYYGKDLKNLTLPQFAMIAGLPKAPSRFNPVVNPSRAVERRNYVLGRMLALGYITKAAYKAAATAPVTAKVHALSVQVEAPYAAEMARVYMEEKKGDEAYTGGYQVYLTIDGRLQKAANEALRDDLIAYDERHGYRGPELHVAVPVDQAGMASALADIPSIGGLIPALVTTVDKKSVKAYAAGTGMIEIDWEGLSWARRYINVNRRGAPPKVAGDILKPGDVIRVQHTAKGWRLSQVPAVEGALVSLDPNDGAVLALVGGFDFDRSKFNRATQAERQPGSAFKPFIYSAALDKGFTPASLINDAPIVLEDPSLESAWRPENYSGKFFGPTRLRVALMESRNLVSIRLLNAIGIDYALGYIARFGLDVQQLPHNLTLALGSATVTPLELARGYAVLANGGYLVNPYYIDHIVNGAGKTIYQARPPTVCRECKLPLTPDAARPEKDMQPPLAAVNGTVRAGPVNLATTPTPVSATAPADATVLAAAGTRPAPGTGEAPPVTVTATTSNGLPAAPRVMSPQTVWLMDSMMRDVIRHGTGRRALVLKRNDLQGKTGTTNDQKDAWFSGFNPKVVTTCWVGFDKTAPLGRRETGAHAALPMWIQYMRVALQGTPEDILPEPQGLVTVRIDANTGELASADDPNAIFETFPADRVPKRVAAGVGPAAGAAGAAPANGGAGGVPEQLF